MRDERSAALKAPSVGGLPRCSLADDRQLSWRVVQTCAWTARYRSQARARKCERCERLRAKLARQPRPRRAFRAPRLSATARSDRPGSDPSSAGKPGRAGQRPAGPLPCAGSAEAGPAAGAKRTTGGREGRPAGRRRRVVPHSECRACAPAQPCGCVRWTGTPRA